jgi:thiosulfate dehydrogenase
MHKARMKSFVLGMLVAPLLFAAVGYACFLLGLVDMRGTTAPYRLETGMLRAAVHASVKRNAPAVSNPIEPSEDNLIAGGKQYLGECSGCHGGPGAPVKYPNQLNPPGPQFSIEGTAYTEAQVFWVAKHGIRWTGMNTNRYWDSDEELWKMAAFIKHMDTLSPRVRNELAKAANGGE